MAEDRYEKVLLNLIDNHEDWIKKATRDIKRLDVSYANPTWKDSNLGRIEMKREEIEKRKININTIWICLNHYRSLLGVNDV